MPLSTALQLCQAFKVANDAMFATLGVLLALLGGVIYSLWAVANAQPRYMRLEN